MSEKSMRSVIVQALKPLDGMAVENFALPGTPDVNFCEGWLELKWLQGWPKNPNKPVPMRHFRPHQRLWIRRRAKAGGKVYIVLQVRAEWLVLDPLLGAKMLGTATRAELFSITLLHMAKHFDPEALVEFLTKYENANHYNHFRTLDLI